MYIFLEMCAFQIEQDQQGICACIPSFPTLLYETLQFYIFYPSSWLWSRDTRSKNTCILYHVFGLYLERNVYFLILVNLGSRKMFVLLQCLCWAISGMFADDNRIKSFIYQYGTTTIRYFFVHQVAHCLKLWILASHH